MPRRSWCLNSSIEQEHYGLQFAAYLHCELHLTYPKILAITQAGCKKYDRDANRHVSKVRIYHPTRKDKVIKVPRCAPPRSKLEPLIRRIEERIGVQSAENGRLAFRPLETVMAELLMQDPGTCDMPPLPFFLGGAHELPIVISLDATGYGSQQFNTIALKNPHLSHLAQLLRIIGLGNCSDDRDGSTRLLGPNLGSINEIINADMIFCPRRLLRVRRR